MKNRNFTLILFAAMAFTAAGQSGEGLNDLSEIRKNKFQVDVDLRSILSGLGGAGLVFKAKIEPGKFVSVSSIKLLRANLRFNNSIGFQNYFKDTLVNSSYPKNNIDMQGGIGIERQYLHKKFVHYYGIDIIGSYYQNDNISQYLGVSNQDPYVYSYIFKYHQYKVGINPFFGVKYYLTDRFSIGIETGVEISYYRLHDKEYFRNWRINQAGEVYDYTVTKIQDKSFSGLLTNFNNIRFLTAGYTF